MFSRVFKALAPSLTSGIPLAWVRVMGEERGSGLMGARPDCCTMHTWYWMQAWRVAPNAGAARRSRHPKARPPLPPGTEDVAAAALLWLPPGVLFAGRLGLDLGIAPDRLLGGRRHL